MTDPQLTALVVALATTVGLGLTFYPGVRRQGASRVHSVLAALMAALMCAALAGLVLGALHSGLAQIVG